MGTADLVAEKLLHDDSLCFINLPVARVVVSRCC
jgi:hypothetical protein